MPPSSPAAAAPKPATGPPPASRPGGPPARLLSGAEIISAGRPGATSQFVRPPGGGKLFEIGDKGALIARLLDGTTPAAEIRRRYAARFGRPLTAEALDLFVAQLAQAGLLENVEPARRRRTFAEALDPEVFLPIGIFRLMRGDRLIAFLTRVFGWVFTTPFHVASVTAMVWALGIIVVEFWGLLGSVYNRWDTEFMIWTLVASSVVVQSPRALVHGMLCKRYGRQIGGIGVALLYFILPTLYVGWADIVWERDRRRRFYTVFSGLYYQGLVFAVATIGWFLTTPGGSANEWFLVLWLAAGGGLVLMNGNPLVAMDAYVMLAAWLEVPNMRTRSLAVFGAWVQRDPRPEPLTPRAHRWMVFYGALAFIYGVGHLAVMLIALWFQLTPGYEGAGALFVLLLTLYMIHKPVVRWCGRFRWVRWLFARRATPAAWVARAVLAGAVVGAGFLPVTYHTGGPFQLLPSARVVVRTEVEGPVEEVLVHEGQWVEAGQPLMQIARRRFEANLARAQGELEKAESRLALLKAGARDEAIESARERVRTASTRLTYSEGRIRRFEEMKRQQLVSDQMYENMLAERDRSASLLAEATADLDIVLSGARDDAIAAREAEVSSVRALVEGFRRDLEQATVRSPIAGRVVTPRIESLLGSYVSPGLRDAVAQIEDPRVLRAEVRVPEKDAGLVRQGARVLLAAWAFHDRTFEGEVVAIAPVAAVPAPDAPLADIEAGQAQVVETDDDEPAVRVLTDLPNPDGRLQAGLTGYAKIEVSRRPLWDILFRPVARWFEVELWSWLP